MNLKEQINYFENKNNIKIDKFSFYYADELNIQISSTNLIYIDIISAFPTICNIIFSDRTEFINKLNNINEKIKKNIFISTNLNSNELGYLNYLCKVFLMNYVEVNYKIINIIEYVKDGIIFDGWQINDFEFEEIKFKKNILKKYIRFRKTSIYFIDDKYYIKGFYKNPPEYLIENLINTKNIKDFCNIYSDLYLNLLKEHKFYDLIKKYYMFNNKYFINDYGERSLNITSPTNILRFFTHPILKLL